MSTPDNSELVQRWRSLFQRYNTPGLPAEEKSSILKNMLTEIDYHRKLGRISEQCYEALNKKYTKEYARISTKLDGIKENNVPKVGENCPAVAQKKEPTSTDSRKSDNVVINSCDQSKIESVQGTDIAKEAGKVERSKSESGILSKNVEFGVKPSCSVSLITDGKNYNSVAPSPSQNSAIERNGARPKIVDTTEPDVVIEKVRKLDIPSRPKSDQSLLNLWASAKKLDNKDNPLIGRPEKRKHLSDSPISKKSHKSEKESMFESSGSTVSTGAFLTAGEQLRINQMRKNGGRAPPPTQPVFQSSKPDSDPEPVPQYGKGQKSLGTRRGASSKFVPPIPGNNSNNSNSTTNRDTGSKSNHGDDSNKYSDPIYQDERLKSCEPRMIELILNEILDNGKPMSWDDIAGLEFAKKTIQEIVVWPMLRPDIFTGLRGPPKGLLLFGPPGTGKTLIGKCIASQSNSTFFTISASSLTSKWVGEGEKMVRTLFAVARCHQPAVVFIDEIDSLLTQRSDQEHESSRRIKTEFLVQLDGACTASDERLLVIGATNRPQEIDEAARRRFVKRLYIPLPESKARVQIVQNLLQDQTFKLENYELEKIGEKTAGYSGSDMANLCREAALGPIRSIPFGEIHKIAAEDVRPIVFDDFVEALEQVKASVSDKDLDLYVEWNNKFGSGRR